MAKEAANFGAGIANADVLKRKRSVAMKAGGRRPSLTVYLDEGDRNDLKIIAAKMNRPMADIIRELVVEWLDKRRDQAH